jgi:hypothetical protein
MAKSNTNEFVGQQGQTIDERRTRAGLGLKTSLEDAGFEQITGSKMEFADVLNAGYLLRLSILLKPSQLILVYC